MRIHLGERFHGLRYFAADQDTVRLLKVPDRSAFGEELRVGEHVDL
jgi:hypothetical protein